MANALYNKAKKAFLDGNINLLTDTLKVVLVDSADYTVNLSTDEFLSDIPAGGRIATSNALSNKVTTDGIFDADDSEFTSVSGDVFEAAVLYLDTGVEGTSRLIAYLDTATGLPFTPHGGPLQIRWSSGADKIFAI